MKRKFSLFVLLSICATLVWGQTRVVTGRVVSDSANVPLGGVNVTIKNSNTTVATKNDGTFSIPVPAQDNVVLTFSSIGYTAKDVPVGTKTSLGNIILSNASASLTDIVVIGYQTVRRRDLTAAVSSVTAKQLKDVPVNSAAEALAGKLAGVQVNVSEGAPGADVDIYVRGRGSITQSAAPLYVVDGVQVENALSILSPQDIESIDVLKDAASTAIYGARGANGVVLITTKGGKNMGGKTVVNYNAFAGFNKLAKKLDMMDPYNFVLYGYERAKYTGNPTDTAVAAQYIKRMSNYDTIANYLNYPDDVDWQDQTMDRRAFQTTHNISVTGGTAATQYNLSLTYNKQQGN
jgi:TonB-dependent SusC/RagA subfamily outer membrane receptor